MSEMKLYALDIETVSQGKRAIDYTNNDKYKAPVNIKDPAKIAANIELQKAKASTKHGLYWWTGKVVSIAIVDVFGDEEDQVFYGHNEEEILRATCCALKGNCKVIGMTSKNFDFPFLVGRFMANLLSVPPVLKRRYSALDVNDFFGISASSGQRGKLDNYAHGIVYAGKPDNMDGSKVQSLYDTIVQAEMDKDDVAVKAGWMQLRKYNLHDSNVVKAIATLYYRDITEVE